MPDVVIIAVVFVHAAQYNVIYGFAIYNIMRARDIYIAIAAILIKNMAVICTFQRAKFALNLHGDHIKNIH